MTCSLPLLIGVPCSFLKVFGGLQQYFLGLPDPHCCIELLHLAHVRRRSCLFICLDPLGLPRAMLLLITSAAQAPCSRVVVSVLHVGLVSVGFVCGMSSLSVMQDRPLKSPPSVATLDSLFNSFTHCASTLCQSFSCCKFWTRRSNQVPLD